jgi:hypothetical protein
MILETLKSDKSNKSLHYFTKQIRDSLKIEESDLKHSFQRTIWVYAHQC